MSGDTAVPMPAIEPDGDTGALTSAQRQRAAALDVARSTLISRSGLFSSQQVGQTFSVDDLLKVSEWVLDSGEPPSYIEPDRESEWKRGYIEGASSAVNEYRRVGDGDQVLSNLLGSDAGRREPTPEPVDIGSHSTLDGGFPKLPSSDTGALPSALNFDDTDVLPTYPDEALPR